jgi:hypothetical protein
MRTKNNFLRSLLAGALALVLIAATTSFGLIEIKNKFIKVIGDNTSGRFVIKTTDGDPDLNTDQNKLLLYEEYPPTSFTTINIDGELYRFGEERGSFLVPLQVKDSTIIATWNINNIDIVQLLEFADGPNTGRPDSVKISYMVQNKDTQPHNIGIRILLDTFLGRNDGAPFRIPGVGEITTETIFKNASVPFYWYAYDDLAEPTVRAQGTLKADGLTPPDMVIFASWDRFNKYLWDFQPVEGRSFRRAVIGPLDSATANYWNPTKIGPGQKTGYSMMYGLYGATILRSDIFNISLGGPATTKGEPVTINADIQKRPVIPAQNCSAEFILPMGLSFADKDTGLKNLGTISSNNVIKVLWNIVPDGRARGEIEYKIIVKGTVEGKEYKTIATRKLTVEGDTPPPPPPPPVEKPKPQITMNQRYSFNFDRINQVLVLVNDDLKKNNDILSKLNELLALRTKVYDKTLQDDHAIQINTLKSKTNTYPDQIRDAGKDTIKAENIAITNQPENSAPVSTNRNAPKPN